MVVARMVVEGLVLAIALQGLIDLTGLYGFSDIMYANKVSALHHGIESSYY